MLDRTEMVRRTFEKVCLVGCPTVAIARAVRDRFPEATIVEPSPTASRHAGAIRGSDDRLDIEPGSLDLLLSLGGLATANDPLETLMRYRIALRPGGLCLGAYGGGEMLPLLRSVMARADTVYGKTAARFHPRLDPASLTQLLSQAGFADPVVDLDQVSVRYERFDRLVSDLRGMAATNILVERSRTPLNRKAVAAARTAFDKARDRDGKVTESFGIVHFSGWAPSSGGDE